MTLGLIIVVILPLGLIVALPTWESSQRLGYATIGLN